MLAQSEPAALKGQAVTLVSATLAVAYCALWELLPGGDGLALAESVGWPAVGADRLTVEVAANTPVSSAVLSSLPVVVADWPSESRFRQLVPLEGQGVVSSLYVGVAGRDGPLGSLGVDVTASRQFRDEEIQFVQAVANLLALAAEREQQDRRPEGRARERSSLKVQQQIALAREQAVREERQRIARDLHDSVIQALYSVTLHGQGARLLLASGDVGLVAEALRSLQETAQEALDELRLLIFDLRPPLLDQVGLVAAIKARLTAVEGRSDLQTSLVAEGVGALPSFVEQELYRIAQEALNNALRHAHAKEITLYFKQTADRLLIEISDDGGGFDPAAARERGGVGLVGIAERVSRLGGRLELQSAPGRGTQLRVEVPL